MNSKSCVCPKSRQTCSPGSATGATGSCACKSLPPDAHPQENWALVLVYIQSRSHFRDLVRACRDMECRQSHPRVRLCPTEVGMKSRRSPGDTWLTKAWHCQQCTSAAGNITNKKGDCKRRRSCPRALNTHFTFHLSTHGLDAQPRQLQLKILPQ